MKRTTTAWQTIDVQMDADLTLSETAMLKVADGILYRTVIYQAPASVAVSMVFIPN
jgi:hypothetical protein